MQISAAVAVGRVLCWVGDEGNSLSDQVRFGELRRLGSPALDGRAGLDCLRCVDPEDSHAKATPVLVADVDGVAVDDLEDECRRGDAVVIRLAAGDIWIVDAAATATAAVMVLRLRFAGIAVAIAIPVLPVVRVALRDVEAAVCMRFGAVRVLRSNGGCWRDAESSYRYDRSNNYAEKHAFPHLK